MSGTPPTVLQMTRWIRIMLDKPSPFTYHTQALARGLTSVVAEMSDNLVEARSIFL
jgi:hypothetical protein